MKINSHDMHMLRVLHEDDDFVTFEMPKRDDIPMRLQMDENGNTVGGDQFYTVLFVRRDQMGVMVWNPWM